MKGAIPTNDGILMASSIDEARGYLIFDVDKGKLTNVEMVWKQTGYQVNTENMIQPIAGCNMAFASRYSDLTKELLLKKGIDPVCSGDEIITNVIVHYIEDELRHASDCCCCP
jgi:predicted Fe-Mo cluster-binding NifX family protein